MSLQDIIAQSIQRHGAMKLDDYMALCLSHPEYGYYMRRDPFGAQGDFTTAPEISQIFGELVGLWLAAQWEKMGKPEATLAEFGPGRGTLMADCLRATKKIPRFHESLKVRLLEISPLLKQKQWHMLAGKHPDMEWIESPDALDNKPLLLIANEFFDALPIRQFVRAGSQWKERCVTWEAGKLAFTLAETAGLPELVETAEEGAVVEICKPAQEIARTVGAHIATHGGAALVIDYGYAAGHGDTLQALKQHHQHDPLETPGEADLTAHVDFAALARAARQAGAGVHGSVPQGQFLMRIGAGQRVQKLCASATPEQGAALISGLERLASPDKMGDLFKVLAITKPGTAHVEGF